MIRLNNKKIDVGYFPDGTQKLLDINLDEMVFDRSVRNVITWCYENDSELLTLIYLKRHIDKYVKGEIDLIMPYAPNGRLDRVKAENEVFTLKYFSEVINNLKFDNVFIFDPHSIVTEALFDNYRPINVSNVIKISLRIIESYLEFIKEKLDVIYFPDDGAYKRYNGMDCFKDNNYTFVYGKKNRDWNTGKILGLDVCDANGFKLPTDALKGKNVLMIDDIISYGGTLAYSADALKTLGADKIYIYASHVENSILDKEKGTLLKKLEDNTIRKIYTTNSIFSGENDKISIIQNF